MREDESRLAATTRLRQLEAQLAAAGGQLRDGLAGWAEALQVGVCVGGGGEGFGGGMAEHVVVAAVWRCGVWTGMLPVQCLPCDGLSQTRDVQHVGWINYSHPRGSPQAEAERGERLQRESKVRAGCTAQVGGSSFQLPVPVPGGKGLSTHLWRGSAW